MASKGLKMLATYIRNNMRYERPADEELKKLEKTLAHLTSIVEVDLPALKKRHAVKAKVAVIDAFVKMLYSATHPPMDLNDKCIVPKCRRPAEFGGYCNVCDSLQLHRDHPLDLALQGLVEEAKRRGRTNK